MPSRFLTHAIVASVLVISGLLVGCEERVPSGPTPLPTSSSPVASAPAPIISGIFPKSGPSGGGTLIDVHGSGFQVGATVTIDGVETQTYPVESSGGIRLLVPPHLAGTADVAVINPDGQRATVRDGFTYVDSTGPVTTGARPSISSISPTIGVTGGGTYVRIAGTAFEPGLSVTLGGVVFRPNVFDGEFMVVTLPHAAGPVDVVVTNPGGQSSTLPGGYTFAEPSVLDFNGTWEGNAGDHWDYVLTFVVENHLLSSVTCDGNTFTFPSPQSTSNGEFSQQQMSGKFFSADYGTGEINIAACRSTRWEAWKQRP